MITKQVKFKGEFCKVSKTNSSYQVAYGWAYVCKKDGETVVDHSGDIWDITEIEKTARQFVCDCEWVGIVTFIKAGRFLSTHLYLRKKFKKLWELTLKKKVGL